MLTNITIFLVIAMNQIYFLGMEPMVFVQNMILKLQHQQFHTIFLTTWLLRNINNNLNKYDKIRKIYSNLIRSPFFVLYELSHSSNQVTFLISPWFRLGRPSRNTSHCNRVPFTLKNPRHILHIYLQCITKILSTNWTDTKNKMITEISSSEQVKSIKLVKISHILLINHCPQI